MIAVQAPGPTIPALAAAWWVRDALKRDEDIHLPAREDLLSDPDEIRSFGSVLCKTVRDRMVSSQGTVTFGTSNRPSGGPDPFLRVVLAEYQMDVQSRTRDFFAAFQCRKSIEALLPRNTVMEVQWERVRVSRGLGAPYQWIESSTHYMDLTEHLGRFDDPGRPPQPQQPQRLQQRTNTTREAR